MAGLLQGPQIWLQCCSADDPGPLLITGNGSWSGMLSPGGAGGGCKPSEQAPGSRAKETSHVAELPPLVHAVNEHATLKMH